MNRSKSHFFCVWAGISWILLSPFFGIPELYCSTYPLDEESVFCTYIMLSGDNINEQDVEELCFVSGKPIYTSFKPSEMFTKQGIIREKNRIIKKIGEIGYDSYYIWEIEYPTLHEKKDGGGTRFILNYKNLPQPTHFINSEITKSGKRLLKEAIDNFFNDNKYKYDVKELRIKVTFRPEKIKYSYQKRNIVYENVVLPIRYVIFHPIKVQILDKTMTID